MSQILDFCVGQSCTTQCGNNGTLQSKKPKLNLLNVYDTSDVPEEYKTHMRIPKGDTYTYDWLVDITNRPNYAAGVLVKVNDYGRAAKDGFTVVSIGRVIVDWDGPMYINCGIPYVEGMTEDDILSWVKEHSEKVSDFWLDCDDFETEGTVVGKILLSVDFSRKLDKFSKCNILFGARAEELMKGLKRVSIMDCPYKDYGIEKGAESRDKTACGSAMSDAYAEEIPTEGYYDDLDLLQVLKENKVPGCYKSYKPAYITGAYMVHDWLQDSIGSSDYSAGLLLNVEPIDPCSSGKHKGTYVSIGKVVIDYDGPMYVNCAIPYKNGMTEKDILECVRNNSEDPIFYFWFDPDDFRTSAKVVGLVELSSEFEQNVSEFSTSKILFGSSAVKVAGTAGQDAQQYGRRSFSASLDDAANLM